MMLIQTQHVFSILTGRDSEWTAQRRQAEVISWREAAHFHWKHTVIGIVIGAITAFLLSPTLLAWLSPTVAGTGAGHSAVESQRQRSSRTMAVTPRVCCEFLKNARRPTCCSRRDELIHAAEPMPS